MLHPISGPEQLQHALVADDCNAEFADVEQYRRHSDDYRLSTVA
jgi:hypothetical protein